MIMLTALMDALTARPAVGLTAAAGAVATGTAGAATFLDDRVDSDTWSELIRQTPGLVALIVLVGLGLRSGVTLLVSFRETIEKLSEQERQTVIRLSDRERSTHEDCHAHQVGAIKAVIDNAAAQRQLAEAVADMRVELHAWRADRKSEDKA